MANDNARFLDALALSIAQTVKSAPDDLLVHLDDMSGIDGAYLCFALMELFGRRGDRAGMEMISKIVAEAV